MALSDWTKPLGIVSAILLGGTEVAAADQAMLAPGDPAPALSLHDQNGAAVAVDASTRVLLLTRDMDGGGFVKEALAEGGKEMLAGAHAVYISDVSRMPGFVRATFAMPSLRKRSYPVALDEDGAATKAFPHVDGKVCVITLAAGKVATVAYAASAAEVKTALR